MWATLVFPSPSEMWATLRVSASPPLAKSFLADPPEPAYSGLIRGHGYGFCIQRSRFFRSSPVLSISGLIVLALGTGVCLLTLTLQSAFFSMASPGMRGQAYATLAEATDGGGSMPVSWQRLQQIRAALPRQIKIAAYSKPISATLAVSPAAQPMNGELAAVSDGFFSAYTLPLAAGRDFTPEETQQSATARSAVILSYHLATRLFGSPARAVHQFVWIDTQPFEVIGVAPQAFRGIFGDTAEAWVPASTIIPLLINPHLDHLDPGAWKQIAAFYVPAASSFMPPAELRAALRRYLPPASAVASPLHVSQGLTADPVRDAKTRKWLNLTLLLAVIFLTISSLNYSLLLLARAPRYAEEIRLKRALGAQSARLLAEIMIGPTAMIFSAVAGGVLLCATGLLWAGHLPAGYGQLLKNPWPLVLRTLFLQLPLIVGLTALVALLPGLQMLREDGAPRMGHTTTATRKVGFWLQGIVVFQMTLAVATWILAGMILAAFVALIETPLGFHPDSLTVVTMSPGPDGVTYTIGPGKTFPSAAAITALLDQVKALPGVRHATLASSAPFEQTATASLQPMDQASSPPRTVNQITITPGYLPALGAKLLQGRNFPAQPVAGNESTILINQSLAKELWHNANPLHRSVRLIEPAFAGMPSFSTVTSVAGVVQNMQGSAMGGYPAPTIYMLLAAGDSTPRLIVNGSESLHALEQLTSREAPVLMPGLRVASVYRVREQRQALLRPERNRALLALAGALTMAVAAYVGLFGALVYFVRARRREFAVRICFGATAWRIRRAILSRAALCAALGTALSLPAWFVLARLATEGYLGQVSWSFERAVGIALSGIALSVVIAMAPGNEAVHISPSEVLKEQ